MSALEPRVPTVGEFGRLSISSPLRSGWTCRWCGSRLLPALNKVTCRWAGGIGCLNCDRAGLADVIGGGGA